LLDDLLRQGSGAQFLEDEFSGLVAGLGVVDDVGERGVVLLGSAGPWGSVPR